MRGGDLRRSPAHRLQLRAVRHLHAPGGRLGRQERGRNSSKRYSRTSLVRSPALHGNIFRKLDGAFNCLVRGNGLFTLTEKYSGTDSD